MTWPATTWIKRLVPILLFVLCPISSTAQGESPPPSSTITSTITSPIISTTTAVRCGRLIDVKAGVAIPNAVLLIEKGKITAVGPEVKIPDGARVIDLGQSTVLPGLIDVHTHLLLNLSPELGDEQLNGMTVFTRMEPGKRALLGAAMARETLEAGFTTVRDLGNSGVNGDVALRDAIKEGWVVGPRMAVSTRALSPIGGQYGGLSQLGRDLIRQEYVEVTGGDEARRAVRSAVFDGATVIKVIVNNNTTILSLEEMKAIVDEAHRSGLKVAAHAIGGEATRNAAQAGVDSIEHAYTVPDDVLRLMAEKKIYLVPTDYPLDFLLQIVSTAGMTPERQKQQQAGLEKMLAGSRERLARAIKLGVPIAAGSDEYYAVPGKTRGQSALQSFRFYAESGMKPLDILRAATIDAAGLLGWERSLGSLEPGKYADLIAVPGNPLEDVMVLEKVSFVMKGGVVVRNESGPP
jgi:imidazolonepropionase-like amidohydrolase